MTDTDTRTDPGTPTPDTLVIETLLTPEGRSDPHPRYRQLRELAPVHRSDLGPVWFLTRWSDCDDVLRDARLGKGGSTGTGVRCSTPGIPPRQRAEMVATLILLFSAGFETTTNLIGNGLVCLLRHPDRFDRLRANPRLAVSAVEEMLRYESPVQVDARTAFEPVDIDGHTIGAGDTLVTFLGAENRDPAAFTDRTASTSPAPRPPPQLRGGDPLLPGRQPGPPRGPVSCSTGSPGASPTSSGSTKPRTGGAR